MNETQLRRRIVKFYDWISSERRSYLYMWEHTEDVDMKTYYGEKASTYTSIKLYLEKYFVGLIGSQRIQETKINGL